MDELCVGFLFSSFSCSCCFPACPFSPSSGSAVCRRPELHGVRATHRTALHEHDSARGRGARHRPPHLRRDGGYGRGARAFSSRPAHARSASRRAARTASGNGSGVGLRFGDGPRVDRRPRVEKLREFVLRPPYGEAFDFRKARAEEKERLGALPSTNDVDFSSKTRAASSGVFMLKMRVALRPKRF